MKIFKTTTRKIILLIFVFVFTFNTVAYGSYNPPREEVEKMIDEVAQRRAIPSVILKAIARVESVYKQFNRDGSPKVNGSSIGLMQVNNRYGGYDSNRLKYDILYNIEAGADVLLNKWSMSSYNSVASVGNMDPNVLENWYFALWAYNGWAQSNNPNMLSSYAKKYTYQQLIYDVCEKEYGQKINNIDFSYLPKSGKPSRSLVVPTPAYTNGGDIILYEVGDYVRTDGIRGEFYLRDVPAGKYIHKLDVNQLGTIVEGPVLQNGYYWYKIYVDKNREGWIERNWLNRTGDTVYGRYVFDDISFHWARKIIMDLFGKGIVKEATLFNPDNIVTREEFLVFLSRTINRLEAEKESYKLEKNDIVELPFEDSDKIHQWAVDYIEHVNKIGLLDDYDDQLNPLEGLTRVEAAIIIDGMLEEKNKFENLDINTIFSDLTSLNEKEREAIKIAYTNGIMSGKYSGSFMPNDYLTRAEAVTVMNRIINNLEKSNLT